MKKSVKEQIQHQTEKAEKQFRFTPEAFEYYQDSIKSGRWKKDRQPLTDPFTPNFRVLIRADIITYHVHYTVTDEYGVKTRPWQMIGHYPDMSIPFARRIARIALGLAAEGINIKDGLLPALIAELDDFELKWRPGMRIKKKL